MYYADTEVEARTLWERGIRTFRLIKAMADINQEKEIIFPARDVYALWPVRRIKDPSKNIANIAHGFGNKYFAA